MGSRSPPLGSALHRSATLLAGLDRDGFLRLGHATGLWRFANAKQILGTTVDLTGDVTNRLCHVHVFFGRADALVVGLFQGFLSQSQAEALLQAMLLQTPLVL